MSKDLSNFILKGNFQRSAKEVAMATLYFAPKTDAENRRVLETLLESLRYMQISDLRSEQITYLSRAFRIITEEHPDLAP